MAEENTPNGEASAEQPAQPQVRMQILAQYIRDLSFENAVATKGAPSGDVQPEMTVQVSLDARKRTTEHQYEVISKFRITSKNKSDDSTMFLIELDYGGVFHVEGVPQEQIHPFLMIECPRMLFPFVRRIVSDLSRDGGFPPFNMDPVDFVALYRQELARRAQAQAQAESGAPANQKLS
ncbi:protein-export chaperone SecB [Paracoccus seriniphilus]|uniref:protein-export chaperone SecB n=1 Tax=Paracoccus seriniphilus TaxID=184748 RepID=UPI0035631E82